MQLETLVNKLSLNINKIVKNDLLTVTDMHKETNEIFSDIINDSKKIVVSHAVKFASRFSNVAVHRTSTLVVEKLVKSVLAISLAAIKGAGAALNAFCTIPGILVSEEVRSCVERLTMASTFDSNENSHSNNRVRETSNLCHNFFKVATKRAERLERSNDPVLSPSFGTILKR